MQAFHCKDFFATARLFATRLSQVDITVADMPSQNRYEATVPDRLIGVLEYHRGPGMISLDHAEVEPVMRGRGIAGMLVVAAMEAARADGVRVVPRCGYVREWLEQHPEWNDLVA